MQRKDCEPRFRDGSRRPALRRTGAVPTGVLLALVVCASTPLAHAGTIRLWPSVVVVDESVRISDLCEFRGVDRGTERALADIEVTVAPSPGDSLVVDMREVRSALATGGANFAELTLHGATRCVVSRPSAVSGDGTGPTPNRATPLPGAGVPVRPLERDPASSLHNLRQAVIDHFDHALARYGGRAEVVFDRAAEKALDLCGPTYEFRIRPRSGSPLGLMQVSVDVVQDARLVQTVPLVVRVSMMRRAVVARRSINQDATIEPRDVELALLTFTRSDALGMHDVARAIGQRAKRFIPAGTVIDAGMLESVPLVTRGQIVTLTSVSGAVRVVTTAKAMDDGLLGESISVRALDHRRIELDAVVSGPGEVHIGFGPVANRIASLDSGAAP